MPLFLSEEEYKSCSHDASLVAEKADAFIRELYNQLKEVDQNYCTSLSDELAQVQADKHQILLKSIEKDEEIERLATEAFELCTLLEQKDLEISEKNAVINGCLDKISDKDGEIERLSTEAYELRTLSEQKDFEISEKNAAIKGYLDKINDYEERLVREKTARKISARKEIEKEAAYLKDKLENNDAEVGINMTVGAKRPVSDDLKKIFVGGIPKTVTEDKFKEFFSTFGTVVVHEIIRDHTSGLSRGFGFIEFDSARVVDTILVNGNRIDMEGANVEIRRAQPKEKPAPAPAPGPSYGCLPGFYDGYSRGPGFYGGYSIGAPFVEGAMWWREFR